MPFITDAYWGFTSRRWPMRDEGRSSSTVPMHWLYKSPIKGYLGIQWGRKQRCKDTINPHNETSKSCPLPGAVCMQTPGRKWHALQSLWSEIAFAWSVLFSPLLGCCGLSLLVKKVIWSDHPVTQTVESVTTPGCICKLIIYDIIQVNVL